MHVLSISWCVIWTLITAVAFHHFSNGENDIIVSDDSEGIVSGIPDDDFVEEINSERFIPTDEWQVIKKGQSIPAGLHVRMNFQTGIKEAKLMEQSEPTTKEVTEKVEEKTHQNQQRKGPKIILADELKEDGSFSKEKLHFTKSHLKQVLHDFKDKVGTKDIEHVTWSDDAKDALEESFKEEKKNKFRTMDEIKKELESSMGWNIKSDAQIMTKILDHLKADNASVEQKSVALDSLEDYVHQVDNGRDLDKIGGLREIVLLLNHSNEILQEKAANVIGAAAQSNKEVQNAIYQHGGLGFLIRMLDLSKEKLTQKKGLYAVSAVIRGNHNVQSDFVKLGGLKALLQIIKQSQSNSIKVKAITLLYDLIVEQEEVMQKLIQAGKKTPNNESPLLSSLHEAGWCQSLIPMLKSEDYDSKEKVIQALEVSVITCQNELKVEPSLNELKRQLKGLEKDIRVEEDADFKSYLVGLKVQLDENVLKQLIPPT